MAPKINKLAPIQIVAPKINKMAPIQNVAQKINEMATKMNKIAPIQTWPQKLIKWQHSKCGPKNQLNGTNLMSVSVQPIAAQDSP